MGYKILYEHLAVRTLTLQIYKEHPFKFAVQVIKLSSAHMLISGFLCELNAQVIYAPFLPLQGSCFFFVERTERTDVSSVVSRNVLIKPLQYGFEVIRNVWKYLRWRLYLDYSFQ